MHFTAKGLCLISGWGTKIPEAPAQPRTTPRMKFSMTQNAVKDNSHLATKIRDFRMMESELKDQTRGIQAPPPPLHTLFTLPSSLKEQSSRSEPWLFPGENDKPDCGLLMNILNQKGGTRGALLTQLEAILASRVTPEKGQHCPDEANLHLCILDLRSDRSQKGKLLPEDMSTAPPGVVSQGAPADARSLKYLPTVVLPLLLSTLYAARRNFHQTILTSKQAHVNSLKTQRR